MSRFWQTARIPSILVHSVALVRAMAKVVKSSLIYRDYSKPVHLLDGGVLPGFEFGEANLFPYPLFDKQTYLRKDFYLQRLNNTKLVLKKIWLYDKLTGGRKNATGGRDPDRHRRNLDFQDLLGLCHDFCPSCGREMNYGFGYNAWPKKGCPRPSLDRRDNNLGYEWHNTHVICLDCNTEKSGDNIQKFLEANNYTTENKLKNFESDSLF